MGELVGGASLAQIGVPGLLTLAVLAVLFGWIFPKPVITRAWAQADAKDADNRELRATLDGLAGTLERIADQIDDLKVAQQATLYAMQEIQVAGRHAAGLEPIARTSMQRDTDDRTM